MDFLWMINEVGMNKTWPFPKLTEGSVVAIKPATFFDIISLTALFKVAVIKCVSSKKFPCSY